MSDTANKAVFLSYASQDAEAARRICEALRSGGVEVWFDSDGGLEHGDEWDAKIRRQVKECVLFIPVISASTQARHEGYFRIEWELAAQRAMGIASGVPFILPVVIDDTREPDALVPDRFRTVQWTRLPVRQAQGLEPAEGRGVYVPPDVQQRFLKLWSHRTGVLKQQAAQASAMAIQLSPEPNQPEVGRPFRGRLGWIIGATAAVALLGALGQKFLQREKVPAQPPEAARRSAPPTTEKSAPQSEARQLAEKARALFDSLDGTRDDYKLAEELIAQAKAKDATDAEVCAAEAQLHERFIQRGWDDSDARREAARAAVQRAARLDPQSFEVRWAQAALLNYTGREGEERTRQLRELRRERPTDRRILRALGTGLERLGHLEEAVPILDESAALPGGDPLALYTKSQTYWFAGRTAEAETAIEASIAQQPFTGALLMNVWYKTILHGDLDGARALLNRISPADLIEDRASFFAYNVEWLAHRPDAAMARLLIVPRDWFNDNWYRGPKGLLVGDAQQLAGRTDAAAIEWRRALKLVEEKLAASPNNLQLLYRRFSLLAKLGQRAEAEQQFALLLQLDAANRAVEQNDPAWVATGDVLLGRKADAIRVISAGLKRGRHAVDFTAADLRLNPDWDPLRSEPEFAAVIAEAEAIEKTAALPSGGSAAAAPDQKSVAVLAFANLSDDKNNEYFSDGISEELLNVLAKVPGLKVTARTSAFFFKGKNLPIPEIAAKLNVAYVVEGSVQRAGDKVKIGARLTKAADGFQVWTDSFTRDARDVFAVEEEIAGLIAKNLSLKLGVSSTAATAAVNPQAFELYVQGRQAWNLRNAEGYARAEEALHRAIALDPNFARAHAALADVALVRGQSGGTIGAFAQRDSPELAQIVAQIERALALDPNSAEAHASLGNARWMGWQQDAAVRELRTSIALNPNYATAHQWLARVLLNDGRMDEALAELKLAAELNPLSARILDNDSWALRQAGNYSASLAMAERALAVQPDSAQALTQKGTALLALRRIDEAVAIARQMKSNEAFNVDGGLKILAGAGLKAEAEAVLPRVTDEGWKFFALAALGRREESAASFDAQRISVVTLGIFLFEPTCDSIRTDPRVAQGLATVGATEAHARAQAWRQAHPPEKPDMNK